TCATPAAGSTSPSITTSRSAVSAKCTAVVTSIAAADRTFWNASEGSAVTVVITGSGSGAVDPQDAAAQSCPAAVTNARNRNRRIDDLHWMEGRAYCAA